MHALLDGRQTVLLRKGGIHEKRFAARRAATSCCSRRSLTATPNGCGPNTATCSTPRPPTAPRTQIVLRAGAKVVAAVEVNRPEAARRHRAAAYLDRRVGARRPAGLPAQAPADGAGGAGQSAGRAGAAARARRTTPDAPAGCQLPVSPTWADTGARRRDAARDRRPGARLSRLTAAAARRAARSRDAPSPRCTVCVGGLQPSPVSSGSPVPRLRANRGCEPPAISTRMREPARNRCAIASSSMRTVPGIGCATAVSVADVAGPALGVHFADPDEHVVVGVVARVRQLDDRVADDIEVAATAASPVKPSTSARRRAGCRCGSRPRGTAADRRWSASGRRGRR